MIILVITGILYCGADRDLLKETFWEKLIPMGEEKPEEDWHSLQGESIPDSVLVGAMDDENQGGEPGQADMEVSNSQTGEPDQAESDVETIESNAVDAENVDSQSQEAVDPGEMGEEEVPTEPEPTPTPEPEIVIGRVEEDYFSDALFLGDSRTVGLSQYGSLGKVATCYASTGMTIYKLLGAEIVELPESKGKITVEEALQHQSFSKIYIMMGINEVGSGTAESFAKAYGEVITRLQELQPDAIIYIEAIINVTTERSAKGDYINNEAIGARNEALSQLADGEKIFYLDVNQAICDEDGGLIKDYTSDGVHLKAKYISLWEEYLKDNAVLLD